MIAAQPVLEQVPPPWECSDPRSSMTMWSMASTELRPLSFIPGDDESTAIGAPVTTARPKLVDGVPSWTIPDIKTTRSPASGIRLV